MIQQNPLVEQFTDLVFSDSIELIKAEVAKLLPVANIKDQEANMFADPSSKQLDNVVIKSTIKTKAEKFNDENSTGIFKDANERVIDCLDNDDVLSYPDCLSFLRTKVAGIDVRLNKFGENSIYWRGHETQQFYIDEISVDIEQLLSVSVADIAIVKAYPPPFFGSGGGGSGGAIAIYTRKGEYRRAGTFEQKWIFLIKGYALAKHVLFSGK
jgi:hypothetical protein